MALREPNSKIKIEEAWVIGRLFFGGLFFCIAAGAFAGDNGFRFVDGECVNSQGESGYNTLYFGQCSDLEGLAIGAFDFSGVDFSGSKMAGTSLQGSLFDGALFRKVDLTGANLSGVSALGAVFVDSDLSGVRWVRGQLGKGQFSGGRIRDANFSEADLSFVKMDSVDIHGVIWEKANLFAVEFQRAQLEGVDFGNTDLSQSQFINVNLEKASFQGSRLDKARFDGVQGKGINWDEVRGTAIEVVASSFNESRFVRGQFSGIRLRNVKLRGAKLLAGNFTNGDFQRVELDRADLRGADFTDVSFSETSFFEATYSKSSKLPFTQKDAESFGMEYFKLSGVSLFRNRSHVDYNLTDSGSEAANVEATLEKMPDYDFFEVLEGEAFDETLSNRQAIVIPELTRQLELPAASLAALRSYVFDGGQLVVMGGGRITNSFINGLFEFGLRGGGDVRESFPPQNIEESKFASSKLSEIRGISATFAIMKETLPESAIAVFGSDELTVVFEVPYGSGALIYLAFDWYNAKPVGSEDGGWIELLELAVQ